MLIFSNTLSLINFIVRYLIAEIGISNNKYRIKFNEITHSKLTVKECQNRLYQKIKQTKQKDSRPVIKQDNNKSFVQQLNESRQYSESCNELSAINDIFDRSMRNDLNCSFM